MKHIPVLLNEILEYLKPKKGKIFIDATYGRGGHSKALIEKKSTVFGIDRDLEGFHECKQDQNRFKGRLYCAHSNFANIFNIVRKQDITPVDGIIFDLGLSSPQVDSANRGFSFLKDAPLDMRMDQSLPLTAEYLVNNLSETELATIIYKYGEEKYSRRIAKNIVLTREKKPIKTTLELVEIISKSVSAKYLHLKTHPATKTFQALRIAVNDELNELRKGLSESIKSLKKGGILTVISFHSLEDRIVKRFFLEEKRKNVLKILTKKPITPTLSEIGQNPRSRSAKLRVAEKI